MDEWEAYDKLDPIGTWREDFRMAYLASLITNLTISVNGKKGTKLTKPIEFMPDWSGSHEKGRQTAEEMKEILLALAKTHNRALKAKLEDTKPPKLQSNTKKK